VTIIESKQKENSAHLKDLGPEPLEKSFTLEIFKNNLQKRKNWKIKQALMDQSLIAGIGNIYADESLWRSSIHPKKLVKEISDKEFKLLFEAIRLTLSRGIDLGGDSMSDYRNIHGNKGNFQEQHQAYQRTGEKCSKKSCRGTIRRIVVGGRATHYCDKHQKLSAE
jgi:formamidopyrimidine-DNA glycosylase